MYARKAMKEKWFFFCIINAGLFISVNIKGLSPETSLHRHYLAVPSASARSAAASGVAVWRDAARR